MPTEQNTGEWIKAERERREITQRGLAELADVHWTTLSAVERGDREPTTDLIIKLAQAFDCTADELVIRLAAAGFWKKPIINGTSGDAWWLARVRQYARGASRETLETAVSVFETIVKMKSK